MKDDSKPLTQGQKMALLEEDHGVGEDAYSVACREEVSLRELDELRKRGFLTEDLKLTESGRKESLRVIRAMKDDGTNSHVENVLTQFQGFLDSTSVLREPNVPPSFALKLVNSYMQWLSRERHRTARVVSAEQTARFVWLAAAFKKVRDALETGHEPGASDATVGAHIHEEPVRIAHADLKAHGDGQFTKVCPSCDFGLLLGRRDDKTLELLNVDRCLHCGQQFIYTDTEIAGIRVVDIVSKR